LVALPLTPREPSFLAIKDRRVPQFSSLVSTFPLRIRLLLFFSTSNFTSPLFLFNTCRYLAFPSDVQCQGRHLGLSSPNWVCELSARTHDAPLVAAVAASSTVRYLCPRHREARCRLLQCADDYAQGHEWEERRSQGQIFP